MFRVWFGNKSQTILDDIDLFIIECLKENSRTKFTDISKYLKISSTAVKRRVDKLVDRGYIEKFTIVVSEKKIEEDKKIYDKYWEKIRDAGH